MLWKVSGEKKCPNTHFCVSAIYILRSSDMEKAKGVFNLKLIFGKIYCPISAILLRVLTLEIKAFLLWRKLCCKKIYWENNNKFNAFQNALEVLRSKSELNMFTHSSQNNSRNMHHFPKVNQCKTSSTFLHISLPSSFFTEPTI